MSEDVCMATWREYVAANDMPINFYDFQAGWAAAVNQSAEVAKKYEALNVELELRKMI